MSLAFQVSEMGFRTFLAQLVSVSRAVHIYKIHVFDEAFLLLTIKMPIVTKLFRAGTYSEDLSPINMHDISTEWSCWLT